MCGIAGQLALAPGASVALADVRRMTDAMIHRGPDDEGFFLDDRRRVALGMRRLSIIDLNGGQQPVFTEDRSITCVLNGEIYNYQPLRRELEARGHIFKSASDTEVLAHLYQDEGVDCLRRLHGMFAFAIWDARTETLVIARDRVGKKPLYYAEAGGRLSFASEISALALLPELSREVDMVALDLYLTYAYIPAPHSIYRTVRKLPPAHVMTARRGRVEIRRYWAIEDCRPFTAPKAELLGALREKLSNAVRTRLISDVPLGCFLSGGVDSSSVVALMSQASSKRVSTFSIGFRDQEFNELPYARAVARRYGTDHHEFVVEADAVEVLPQIVRHFGEPFGDSSAIPAWYLAKVTRQHVTVALNGDGGDELFAGYNWYRSARTLDRLVRALPAAVPALLARGLLGPRARRLGRRMAFDPAARFASLRCFLDEETKARLYGEPLLRGRETAADRYVRERYEQACGDGLWRLQHTDITSYLPEDLLVKIDRMTMAHSVEGRSPLLDHELMEFCARIPDQLKVDAQGGKAILREAMRPMFPEGFFARPKMGFSVPLARWLRTDLRDECHARIFAGPLVRTGWIQMETVKTLLDEHAAGRCDWSAQIWNLLVLAEWVEAYGA